MPKIAIITDSDASLPQNICDKFGIYQVPITVNFGTEVLKTGIDIDDRSLFERVDREGKLPTTSAPAPGEFSEVFEKAFDSGAETILCFCVSGEISATYSAALSAYQLMLERDIHIVDTRNLTMAQGFMVIAAAEAAKDGLPVSEILTLVEGMRERIYMFGVLPTLKYLAMSGRVGHLAAGFANVINIKPILTVRDGKLDLLERVRTLKKAWARAIQLCEDTIDGRQVERLAIVHVRAETEATEFYKQFKESINYPGEVWYAELTPGLSVHSGAGMVGVCFVVGE